MSTTKKTKPIEINQAQVDLDTLRMQIEKSTTITVVLAINTLTGHGVISFSPLLEGDEIRCTNLLIDGLEQLLKMERDKLTEFVAKEKANQLMAEHMHSHNGVKESA